MPEPIVVALIAAAGGLVGGAIASLIGGVLTLIAQGREQAHARNMAREQRLQDRRARAYERVLEHAYRLDAWVERTHPFMGPKADPPAPVPDDQLFKLNALTAAHSSPEVQALVMGLTEIGRRFNAAGILVTDERAGGGIEGKSGLVELEQARADFHGAARALADRAGEELRGQS